MSNLASENHDYEEMDDYQIESIGIASGTVGLVLVEPLFGS